MQDEDDNIIYDSPEAEEALTWYADLHLKHKVVPPGAAGWTAGIENNKVYLAGQVATAYNPGSIIYQIREDPELAKNTVLGPMPAGPEGSPQDLVQSRRGVVFTTSPFQEEAKELFRQVMSHDIYVGYLRAAGSHLHSPLRNPTRDEFFLEDPWNKAVVDMLPIMTNPGQRGSDSIVLGESRAKKWWGDMLSMVCLEGKSPKEAIDWITKNMKEAREKLG